MSITHFDIIREGRVLAEASFSRIWQHIQKGNGLMIISAYRTHRPDGSAVPDETNIRNTKRLAGMVRSEGLGFFYLDGRWQDEEGIVHPEVSILVPGDGDADRMGKLARKLRRMFDQDAVLLVPPGSNEAILIKSGGATEKLGSFRPDSITKIDLEKVWSEVKFGGQRGRKFTFEAIYNSLDSRQPVNMMGAWARMKEKQAATV